MSTFELWLEMAWLGAKCKGKTLLVIEIFFTLHRYCTVTNQLPKYILDLVMGLYISLFILGDDALVQVYPEGIRHIRADKRVNEWKAPGKKTVMNCAVNRRQVVIALSGGELVYFEMDPVSLKHRKI